MNSPIKKPTEVRRREIVDAVLEIIGTEGFSEVTTNRLAKEVNLSSGAVFRHFQSRDEILEATTAAAVLRIESTFPSADMSALERIGELARNRIHLFKETPGLAWLLRSDQAELVLPPSAAESLRTVVERTRRFILTALREGADGGTIRRDVEPEYLLLVVMGTVQALVGMKGVHGGVRQETTPVLNALETLLKPI